MERNSSNNSENIKLTRDEALQLEKALADKEFRKLLAEYVEEISDPKYRNEQEMYIRQLESKNEIPQGKQIIKPNIGFVLKFKYTKKTNTKDSSSITTATTHKLFVNVVSSTFIDEPKITNETNQSRNEETKMKNINNSKIQSWSIPYSFGPLRMEKDKNDSLIPTFDCCFHPDSLINAKRIKGFQDLLAQTARDGVIHSFKVTGEKVLIKKDYRILCGVNYKNGSPPVMMIDTSSHPMTNEFSEMKNDSQIVKEGLPKISNIEKKVIDDQVQDGNKANIGNGRRSQLKKGFLSTDKKNTSKERNNNKNSKSLLLGGGYTNDEKEIPEYTVSERTIFDLADNTTHHQNYLPRNRMPKSLVYRIYLTKISNASEIDLEVKNDEQLVLQSIAGVTNSNYFLNVKLPYKVLSNDGDAKWDSEKKVLTLILTTKCTEKSFDTQ